MTNAKSIKQQAQEIFECVQPLHLTLTKKACANFYYKANKIREYGPLQTFSALSYAHYCFKCETGKMNYELFHVKGKEKPIIHRKKQCELYQVDPTQCVNEKIEGWFFQSKLQKDANWKIRKFCSPRCGVVYNQLKYKGRIK